jgi:putative ABC transport system ATP-binding protein
MKLNKKEKKESKKATKKEKEQKKSVIEPELRQLPDKDAIIELRNMNKYYTMGENSLHVLKDVSIKVKRGEFLAILGPSGSGKSTLMNMIGCMDVPDDGEYYLDGAAIHATDEKDLANIRNEKIGFIFQKYHLIPTYDVLQNIVMPLLMRGMTLNEAKEKSIDTIGMLGLSDRMEHKPGELSGGQQQRVAIARALVGEPAILLADEPTGALDSNSGQEVLKLFQKLNDMGNTIVMITHDLNVAKHAERVVRIVDGELFEEETCEKKDN